MDSAFPDDCGRASRGQQRQGTPAWASKSAQAVPARSCSLMHPAEDLPRSSRWFRLVAEDVASLQQTWSNFVVEQELRELRRHGATS